MSSLPLKLTKPPLRYPKPLYQPFDVKQFHFYKKIAFFQFWHSQLNFHEFFLKLDWLDLDLIPKLLEIFENFKKFIVILLSVKNDVYKRIWRRKRVLEPRYRLIKSWKFRLG